MIYCQKKIDEGVKFAETVNDLSILAGSTDKLLNTGGNTGGMGGFNQHWQQQQHTYQQQSRSQTKRLKMTYHCKFGEFGVMEGNYPSIRCLLKMNMDPYRAVH